MKEKRSRANILIIIVCIIVILASLAAIIYILYPKHKEKEVYEKIEQIAQDPELGTIDWEELQAINPDVVAWITIPGTHINYPIVQTDNNDYYLTHNFNNEYSGYGTPFLDYTFNFDRIPIAQNSVIYGHNSRWGDEVGFQGIDKYENENYFLEHPTLYYTTVRDGNTPVEYEIIAAIKEDAHFDYRRPDFADQEDFLNYYNNILSHKLYETGKGIFADDQIVTLSSCTFDTDNGRIAIIARRVS